MGERKVLNKYFPPDFDPAKIPRSKKGKTNEMKVRMMLPMSLRCRTCGAYMYKGTKFNTRKEDVVGEAYLGIQVFRFYFRCSTCAAEITFKTDPQNSDYSVEHGASRNYEPWREKDAAVAEAHAEREEEEKGNAMKALENRTLDSKREMDILTALDEMRSLKARHEAVGIDAALAALKRSGDAEAEAAGPSAADVDEEDEQALRALFFAQRAQQVKRLPADGGGGEGAGGGAAASASDGHGRAGGAAQQPLAMAAAPAAAAADGASADKPATAAAGAHKPVRPRPAAPLGGLVIKAKKPRVEAPPPLQKAAADVGGGGALIGLGAYGSSSGGSSEED